MVPDSLSRAQLPALLLVVIGLSLVMVGGVQATDLLQKEYTYDVDEFEGNPYPDAAGNNAYMYSSLSNESKAVTQTALNSSRTSVTVTGDRESPTEEFDVGSGPYYILHDGGYYCLEFRQSGAGEIRTLSGNLSVSADQQCLQNTTPEYRGFYPNESALSSDARDVLASAIEAPDGEISRSGPSPSEFDDGADSPSFGSGRYVVQYEGTYYKLSVSASGSSFDVFVLWYLLFIGAFGLGITATGWECYKRDRVTEPAALLSGITIIGGSIILYNLGLLSTGIDEYFRAIIISGIVVPVILWVVLTWRR
jgi:hypothetical protein